MISNLLGDSSARCGDPLLAVQHLRFVRRDGVEIDQPADSRHEQRSADDRLLFLAAAVGIWMYRWYSGWMVDQTAASWASHSLYTDRRRCRRR